MRILIILAAGLALGGCATAPENIAAIAVTGSPYQSWQCKQIAAESEKVTTALAAASRHQQDVRDKDTMGLMIIGLPVASIGGQDSKEEVAHLKGQAEALQQASDAKRCDAPGVASKV
jgi:hypothetical protein